MNTFARFAACAAGAVASTAAAQSAFTDFAAWEAAAGNPAVTDDFSSYGEVTLNLGSNDFNGFSIVLDGTGTGGTAINSATNLVFTLGDELQSITFEFDQPITGFGGTWLNSFVSNGLTVEVNGIDFNVEDSVGAPNFDFIGWAGGGEFNSPTITVTNPTGATEFAALSSISWAPIPAPASAALLGLGGLAAARRRR
ncbi:MAG: hypothetical protein AAGJ54_10895 [Planctomycetota bacterium]